YYVRRNGLWVPKPDGVLIDVFTASGTWTKPTGAKFVLVKCFAGGGGGGGLPVGFGQYSGGGGGGGFSELLFQAFVLGSTEGVIVGSGGNGATMFLGATKGGNSAFGWWIETEGGFPGRNHSAQSTAGSGGSGARTSSAQPMVFEATGQKYTGLGS